MQEVVGSLICIGNMLYLAMNPRSNWSGDSGELRGIRNWRLISGGHEFGRFDSGTLVVQGTKERVALTIVVGHRG